MTGIYARVSTEEQAVNGYSLHDQIRECRKKAGDDEVIEYIDKGVSGEIVDRPALSRLRQDLAGGKLTRVICFDPDRLSRKLIIQLILSDEIEKKAELVFVNGEYSQTPEGKLFYQLRGAIAEFEKAKINERMSRGRKEKARQGFIVRDYSIYGYDYSKENKKLVINPKESEVVKLIFEMFTGRSGKAAGISEIARYLTRLGIPTKRGAALWYRQVIRQILMNRTYLGEFYQNRWLAEGTLTNKYKPKEERTPVRERPREEWIKVQCPPIIDKETFDYAQKLLAESRRRWAGTSKHKYLLSGLLRCGICGSSMTGKKRKGKNKYAYEYSDSRTLSHNAKPGCGIRINAEQIEEAVWEKLLDILSCHAPFSGNSIDFIQNSYKRELEIVEGKMATLGNSEKNLLKLISYFEKELDFHVLKNIFDELASIDMQKKELIKIREDILFKLQNSDLCTIEKPVDDFDIKISFCQKQKLIRLLFKEIIVNKDKIIIYGF
ncbi:MAG TPA: recombinase family protein [Clostridiaceae bacterium]|nr:recombinase family protein [Clostridiaceae bacterium]